MIGRNKNIYINKEFRNKYYALIQTYNNSKYNCIEKI